MSATDINRLHAARVQRDGLHAPVALVAAALAEATGQSGDEDDGQCKKKSGTTTMHEPSSRPFARREINGGGRKTASVEGQVQGFKVSGLKVLL